MGRLISHTGRQNFEHYGVQMLQTWVQALLRCTLYHNLHITISFVLALYERPESLKICVPSPLQFCSVHSLVGYVNSSQTSQFAQWI